MTGIAAPWENSGERTVNHSCPAEGLGRQMTEFTCGGGREVVCRLRHDAAGP
jgi:hypothetical protein